MSRTQRGEFFPKEGKTRRNRRSHEHRCTECGVSLSYEDESMICVTCEDDFDPPESILDDDDFA